MRRTMIIVLLAFGLLLVPQAGVVRAQAQVIETHVVHEFGEKVIFTLRIKTDIPIEEATIFFQAYNESHTQIGEPQVEEVDESTWELVYTHDISDYALPAYTAINYRYDIALQEDGGEIQTGWYSFYYDDNRFEWEVLVEGPFRIYWYDGDLTFAQDVQDAAQEGLNKIQNLLLLPIPNPTRIYVYPDAKEMQTALNPASAAWVAGHANPELGVMVVALPEGPDQVLLIEQRIPHELMHIALYRKTVTGYANLPIWLSEGLASQVELYPNSDYRIMLEFAALNDSLLPMSNLCRSFPREASNALLAYAQADSFTRYLYRTYGTTGLNKLVTNYANGLDCDNGAKAALGKDLSQLERAWLSELTNENLALTTFTNLLPWLIFLLFALGAPLGLALYFWRSNRSQRQAVQNPASESTT